MMQKQHDPNHHAGDKFEGEEAGAGYAAPLLDLIASGVLIVLSVVVMVASFTLPAPGGVFTAPGLLPFLTALSLLLMAIMLGVTALKRRATGVIELSGQSRSSTEYSGTLMLAVTIAVYIAALQLLAFQHNVVVAGAHFTISAFEPATIITLSMIIHVAWRGPLWITTTVSILWTLILSVIFQKVFLIPLPGGF